MGIVIMNTKTRQNFTKPITNEYIADDYYKGALIFQRGYIQGQGAFFAVPAEGTDRQMDQFDVVQLVTHDTGMGNVRGGEARIVGWVGKDGHTDGVVPTKSVPVYVFK